ncbi:hypothetical protein E1262_15765 [Jiangella aurantiaca]|uniref:Lipoprotein n=1 Tax=Jiangella aurantiaca TaxID=2530373 RepID=A0A4R5A8D5_9ACTN|nr:DUF6624 domain-containing protein [Jiangella aurantiaca]TDD68478.1 hypothetical protein E1262_15765 [Jiangella aurantiaca]
MIRAAAVLVALLLVACTGDHGGHAATPSGTPSATTRERNEQLRAELLEMMEQDQAERSGEVAGEWNDQERTDRLAEIIEEHGWPGSDLVGTDGASAAWVIAQHSDLDPEFQRQALELMRPAAEAGLADPGELAYLEDRVALNSGGEQVYGTQIGCVDGVPQPAPLSDPETVDERRAEAGLEPLADYLATLEEACAAEAAASASASPTPFG